MQPQEVRVSGRFDVEDTEDRKMPIGEWRWTPPPPSIPQQGQVGSIAEFGPYSDFVGSTGNSAIGSHEQHPWAQMPSGPGPVQQRNAAASTGREASTAMIPTVPDWNALFSEDNEGAVGMFPGSGGNVQPLFIPHANDESYDNPLFPPYPTSTAMPVSRTTPTTSSFHAPTTATSTTAHIPTRPHHSAHQESRGQTGAADGRNIQGVNVQWDPLNVNGVRVLYAVHGYRYEVDPSGLPFHNPTHAGGVRPGFFVATSGPVDPRSVLRTSDTATATSTSEQGVRGQNAPGAHAVRQTRPLPARRGRGQRGSGAAGRQVTVDTSGVQGSSSRHGSH